MEKKIELPENAEKIFTACDNGGPMLVHVKDGRIIRIRPMTYHPNDVKPWTIKVGEKSFSPPLKSTLTPYAQTYRRNVYSHARVLYPMKRVDFDPKGERNTKTRMKGDYVRISWDEALDIITNEIKRVDSTYGPGAIYFYSSGHAMWGNVHFHGSSLLRFQNFVRHTNYVHNPTSWEGWYTGANHIWGYDDTKRSRYGNPEQYGLLEDALKNSELIVHWSNDPENTFGLYGHQSSAIWRLWIKELGKKQIFIDPFCNYTAAIYADKWIAPRPGTDTALALAIAYVWLTEETYDKVYVKFHTFGFDKWVDYVLGKEDSIPKTPKWAEQISDVPSRVIKALAREWASKRTALAIYFGGANRTAYGHEWSRMMVLLQAMQGLGKPGVNFWSTAFGAPMDLSFATWGYHDGGINRVAKKIPQNPVKQYLMRLKIPDGILNPPVSWYGGNPRTLSAEGVFSLRGRGPLLFFEYPQPGYSEIKMIYRFGGSTFGTMPDGNKWIRAYQSPKIEFIVCQTPWLNPDAKYADIILPSCPNLERSDIAEMARAGNYGAMTDMETAADFRVVVYLKKCIEPLGESKSDLEIFTMLAERLGFKEEYTEGNSEEDWIRKLFEDSDLPKFITYEEFKKKGYFIFPLPDDYKKKSYFNERALRRFYLTGGGLKTPSGKIEFFSQTLHEFDPEDKERPPVPHYTPSFEGHTSDLAMKYPLQLIAPHPRFQLHTQFGNVSWVKEVQRVYKDGYYWWPIFIHPSDAKSRGIQQGDIVKVYNDRATVLCITQVSERVRPGVVVSQYGAWYDPIIPGESHSIDKGGCVNLLITLRHQSTKATNLASNSCLVEVLKWEG